jgi:uncharacterized protein (TIGR02246 family)
MTDFCRRTLIATASVAAFAASAKAEPALELGPILDKYAAALKAEDVEAAVRLFTANGIYIAPGHPAWVGRDALRTAFRQTFQRVTIDIDYDIQEAAKYRETGWLRSTAKGKVKLKAGGQEGVLSYNQLVVFEPEAGVWKIRSYAWTPAQ